MSGVALRHKNNPELSRPKRSAWLYNNRSECTIKVQKHHANAPSALFKLIQFTIKIRNLVDALASITQYFMQ
ncbi:Hypothetical protein Y17_4121 [Pectobacterium wasabiae CFBP 3304]|nr:Hypothetical protein Y17_4121 [Pectobacterium wasabiae CFBP 3304]